VSTSGRLITHVVGARPNFIKAAPVVRALANRGAQQRLVHTGQHYDALLSDVFFRDLDLPQPDVNLGVGSGTQAEQTAALLVALERAFGEDPPRLVVVYGDVNSTLAGALVAAKMLLSVAHVEAGLRSFDRTMPEETNRRVADVLSDLLFVTAPEGIENLTNEGVAPERVHFVGNPMIDTLDTHLDRLDPAAAQRRAGVTAPYAVATIHRPSNVDTPVAAHRIATALTALSESIPVVLPLHPRGRATLEAAGLRSGERLRLVAPLGYLEFASLLRGARLAVTDSGGVQEETTVLGVPCLTVRENTERPITITAGTNRLVDPEGLVDAAAAVLAAPSPGPRRPHLWDGHAGERIADAICAWLATARPA
jgi:UDP-N-acetylglucosamine 2-epimerase (non-hydrolysing)